MKNKAFNIVIIVSLVILSACSKKENDFEADGVVSKLQGRWMITGFINNDGENIYSSLPACEKDNIISYDKYTVSVDEGSFKCDASDPQSFLSSFALKSNGFDILTYVGNDGDDLDDMQIIFVDDNTLKLKDAEGSGVVTYTKIPTTVIYSQISIVGKWKLSGMVAYGVDVWNLPVGTCLKGSNNNCVGSLSICLRDDIITYASDNKFVFDEGSVKCSSSDPQTTTGSFSFDNQKNQITVNYRGSTTVYNIILINASTLIIREVGDASSDFEMYQRL
jgi:hypothetical protein